MGGGRAGENKDEDDEDKERGVEEEDLGGEGGA